MKSLAIAFVVVAVMFFALSGCTPLRGAQNYENPTSPCEANYKSDGGRTSGYKTSSNVSFLQIPDVKVFNAVTIALTDSGYTILTSDKEAGIITANYNAGDMVQARISVQVKKIANGANVLIKITTPAVYGDIPADCCQLVGKIEENLGAKAMGGASHAAENFSEKQESALQKSNDVGTFVKAKKNCNVRPEASTKKAPIAKLQAGDTVEKIAQQGEWFKIRLDNGSEGWVSKSLVE